MKEDATDTKEEIVRTFDDNSVIKFTEGKFDRWCVCISETPGKPVYPKDSDYFTTLKEMGEKYGNERVYNDVMDIYDTVERRASNPDIRESRNRELHKQPNNTEAILDKYATDWTPEGIDNIDRMAEQYNPEDILTLKKIFTTVYMGMIAEENNGNAWIGKDMKALALHQILIEGQHVDKAVNFSRKKNPKEELWPMSRDRFYHRRAALKYLNRNNVQFEDIPEISGGKDTKLDINESGYEKDQDTFFLQFEYHGKQYGKLIPKNSAEYIVTEQYDSFSNQRTLTIQMPANTTFEISTDNGETVLDEDLRAVSAGELYVYEKHIDIPMEQGPFREDEDDQTVKNRGEQAETQLDVNRDTEKSENNKEDEP